MNLFFQKVKKIDFLKNFSLIKMSEETKISWKKPREFWKFDKTKLNPFHKDQKPLGISYESK